MNIDWDWLKEKLMASPSGKMSAPVRFLLLWYLLPISVLLLYGLYGIWGAVPAPAPQIVFEEPDLSGTSVPADGPPQILQLDRDTVTIGADRGKVRIFGHNFASTSEVRFDGVVHPANYIDQNRLVASLNSTDLSMPGTIMTTVVNGTQVSNAVPLLIASPSAPEGVWKFFSEEWPLSAELRLFLLVVFAGAFGASVISLQSFADYRGAKNLGASWTIFYFVRPQIGAGVAVVFYYAIRGGFLAGTDVEFGTETPFGIVAVSAMVGMFSDKAVLKLNEVFTSLFKSDDERQDKLGGPVIEDTQLADATNGQPYEHELKASSAKPPLKWAVKPQLPAGLVLDADSGKISGTPTASSPTDKYTFTATDAKGVSAPIELELTVI